MNSLNHTPIVIEGGGVILVCRWVSLVHFDMGGNDHLLTVGHFLDIEVPPYDDIPCESLTLCSL